VGGGEDMAEKIKSKISNSGYRIKKKLRQFMTMSVMTAHFSGKVPLLQPVELVNKGFKDLFFQHSHPVALFFYSSLLHVALEVYACSSMVPCISKDCAGITASEQGCRYLSPESCKNSA
jgi:hypothetical protein